MTSQVTPSSDHPASVYTSHSDRTLITFQGKLLFLVSSGCLNHLSWFELRNFSPFFSYQTWFCLVTHPEQINLSINIWSYPNLMPAPDHIQPHEVPQQLRLWFQPSLLITFTQITPVCLQTYGTQNLKFAVISLLPHPYQGETQRHSNITHLPFSLYGDHHIEKQTTMLKNKYNCLKNSSNSFFSFSIIHIHPCLGIFPIQKIKSTFVTN